MDMQSKTNSFQSVVYIKFNQEVISERATQMVTQYVFRVNTLLSFLILFFS